MQLKIITLLIVIFSALSTVSASQPDLPGFVIIPEGSFEMGDHAGLGGEDPNHPSDEQPIHTVFCDSFYMGTYEVTNKEYCAFLNGAFANNAIEVKQGVVYMASGTDTLFKTTDASKDSRIAFDGTNFTILNNKENHPVTDVRWFGAAAYCNWLSEEEGYAACFDVSDWVCDFDKDGYRLPTEAEWEYAGRGGQQSPYRIFPWGDDKNESGSYANWQESGDPYEEGDYPLTTPVGFYNGEEHSKADYSWPGVANSYQTADGSNPYGLYDIAGNVWEWVYDWYSREYYETAPEQNPRGPDEGKPMPDGKPYRTLRGGNWYNGKQLWGHARVANRDPAYFRGPQDPIHPYYHVGFRVAKHKHIATPITNGISYSNKSVLTSIYQLQHSHISKIHFTINHPTHLQIDLFSLNGNHIKMISQSNYSIGKHTILWDGLNKNNTLLNSGVFICKFSTKSTSYSLPIHIIK